MVHFYSSLRVKRAVFEVNSRESSIILRPFWLKLSKCLVEIIEFFHKRIQKTLVFLTFYYNLLIREDNSVHVSNSNILKLNIVVKLILTQILKVLLNLYSPFLYKFDFFLRQLNHILLNFPFLVILIEMV